MSNPELDPVTSKTTNTEITPLQKIEGFHKLIDNADTAMLVTRCESGALHSRAMTPCRRTYYSDSAVNHGSDITTAIEPTQINLFFIANNASHKFDELKHDSNVNVSFYDKNTTGWASVSGIAKVTQDKDLIKKFWSPMFGYPLCSLRPPTDYSDRITSFFGDLNDGKHDGSKDDPRVSLIEVIPNEIRYWVSTSSTISRTAEIAYGAVTGKVQAPGEFRVISDTEVCHFYGVSASFMTKPSVTDQTRPRLE